MLLLVIPIIVFFFLCIGSLVFVSCILLRQTRGYALSAALWCAMWAPCVIALLILAGIGLIADFLAQEHTHFQLLERLPSAIGPTYAILGIFGTIIVASIGAWLHQKLIHRMTFALFRIYSGLVVAGIGSVWGWAFNFWIMGKGFFPLGFAVLIFLCVAFGYGGLRWARQLRGRSPRDFTWITPEEFEGNT